MNNSDYLVNYLLKNNIDTAFGVTGGGAMFLNEAFRKRKKLKFVYTHHEQSAAMAAEAYCRVKKKPAILSVTSGPGGTNAITGVIGSWVDSIPMIVISGQVELKDTIKKSNTRQIGIQEVKIIDIVKSITKYCKSLDHNSDIELEIRKAVSIANEGRPGPVWLDIPLDIQSKKFLPSKKKYKLDKKALKKKKLDTKKIFSLIDKSSRPLILIGNGLHVSKSEKEFLKFIKSVKIPVLSSWNASDILPSNHKLNFGRPGLFGNRISNFALQACDLLIILGSRLSVPITGYQIKNFSPKSKKIYIDIDKYEMIKRNLKIDYKLNIDLKIFLKKLNLDLKNKKTIIKNKWVKTLRDLDHYLDEDNSYKDRKGYINSFNFIHNLSDCLSGNENIVTDMGTSFTCTMQSFKTKYNQRLFTSSGVAAMGFGLPGLLGVYFAQKNKKPICITGDGGIMFNLQELQTIINHKIPAKIFIINNQGYLTMKLMQKKNFKKFVGADKKSGVNFPDFIKLSSLLGYQTLKITNQNNLRVKLKKILKSSKPTVCEVMMPPMQELTPRVQTQMNKDGTFEPSFIDNMYPFLNKRKLNEIRKKLVSI